MNKATLYIIFITALIGVGGGAFYGGMQFKKSQTTSRFAEFQSGNFQGLRSAGTPDQARNNGSGVISGQIVSKDENSITVQLADGSSKIIFFSGSTQIGKFEQGTAQDLTGGQNITIIGQTNSDGAITAESIQIRPEGQSPIPSMQTQQ